MTGDASPSGGGKVYLVGAGPGDPDLLTVRARRIIDTADLVMYDSLVDERVVEGLPAGTTTIDVGKKPGPDGRRHRPRSSAGWWTTPGRGGRWLD